MVSSVRAQLADDRGAMDLVRAIFPCGSITGAPKIRAMELIDAVERDARGPYCGAIGRIGSDGNAAFNVAIRTLRLTPIENGQGTAVLGVGSAIVADSDPQGGTARMRGQGGLCAGLIRESDGARFDLIETMIFDPEHRHSDARTASRADEEKRAERWASNLTATPRATRFRRCVSNWKPRPNCAC
jgi:para-aminobenzoate synthetase/4-amino-4-deoxychorismate lyase